MKKYIIIALIIIPGICFAQKENQLEFSYAHGIGYNYGVGLSPVSYHYTGLSGFSKKTYYGVSVMESFSTQFGVLFFPKHTRLSDFSLGVGVQFLKLQSTVTADSSVSEGGYYFPPYSYSKNKVENLKWEVEQPVFQLPVLIRYQHSFDGRNGIYADAGALFSRYKYGVYPDGIPEDIEVKGKRFWAFNASAGYQYKLQLDNVSCYINIGATYQRTWTASVLGQKHGFLGTRVSLALGWEQLPE